MIRSFRCRDTQRLARDEDPVGKQLPLISPGEIRLEEFLKPAGLSQNQLARAIDVPTGRVNDIIRGRRGITRDTALWINLQARFDAKIAQRDLMPVMSRHIRRHAGTAA